MSIRKTRVVDWLGIGKGSGDVLLVLVDDEDWTNEHEHLELLQEKLNTYLAFIESGEIYERLAAELGPGRNDVRTAPIKVNIVARCATPPRAQEFLKYAAQMFTSAGFSLVHEVVPDPS